MLKVEGWSCYDGCSEVDGNIVMRFFGRVNRADPEDIEITEKEEFEDSYRNNIDVIRQDRRIFEDKVYFEASRIKGLLAMEESIGGNEIVNEDISSFTVNDDDQEYHGEWSSVPTPDDANTMKGDIVDEV